MLKSKTLARKSNYTCHIDDNLKTRSNALFNSLGMSLETAINIFLMKSVRTGGLPFDVSIDDRRERTEIFNRETVEAMLEAESIARNPDMKGCSVEEAFKELEN